MAVFEAGERRTTFFGVSVGIKILAVAKSNLGEVA